MYAIVETGNKQYRVSKGDVIDIDLRPAEKDSSIKLSNVLLLSDNDDVIIGQPYVKDASIDVIILEPSIQDDKVICFKYKNKTGYRRTRGHRQRYTRVKIESINKG